MKWLHILFLLASVVATIQIFGSYVTSKERLSIKVSGRSEIVLPAELAILKLGIHHESNHRRESMDKVLNSTAEVKSLLEKYNSTTQYTPTSSDSSSEPRSGRIVDYWELTAYRTGDHRNRKYDDWPREYFAKTAFIVHLKDLDMLGTVTDSLTSVDHVRIANIEWVLTEETARAIRTRAREAAVHNGRAKAIEYAMAASGIEARNVKAVKISHEYSNVPTTNGEEEFIGYGWLAGMGDVDSDSKTLDNLPSKVRATHKMDMTFVGTR